jgi:hypothetical protein
MKNYKESYYLCCQTCAHSIINNFNNMICTRRLTKQRIYDSELSLDELKVQPMGECDDFEVEVLGE